MEKSFASGFKEIAHTADWELEVWAPDLASLFEQAAQGMLCLMGMRLANEPASEIQPAVDVVTSQKRPGAPVRRVEHRIRLQAADGESLLVAFLSEILYLFEQHGLGFDRFEITIQGNSLECRCSGAPALSVEKEIKAVTYHNLNIRRTERGVEVCLVFDV